MKKPKRKPRRPLPTPEPTPAPEVVAPEPVEDAAPVEATAKAPERDDDLVPIAARIKRADAIRLNRHAERIQAQRPMAIVGMSEPIREAIGFGLDIMDARYPEKKP